MPATTHLRAAQTTTDSFVDLGDPLDLRSTFSPSTLTVTNTGVTNGLSFQILGSIDKINWHVVVGSANVAPTVTTISTITGFWPWLKVQVKAQVGSSQTTASCAVAAASSI